MKRRKMEIHKFFCINCGRSSMGGLPRSRGARKEKFHRKKIYCLNCRCYCNHIECRNEIEGYEFKERYIEGSFVEEAKESIKLCNEEEWSQ